MLSTLFTPLKLTFRGVWTSWITRKLEKPSPRHTQLLYQHYDCTTWHSEIQAVPYTDTWDHFIHYALSLNVSVTGNRRLCKKKKSSTIWKMMLAKPALHSFWDLLLPKDNGLQHSPVQHSSSMNWKIFPALFFDENIIKFPQSISSSFLSSKAQPVDSIMVAQCNTF